MGFEYTIPVFELAKTVHALDRAATVICKYNLYHIIFPQFGNCTVDLILLMRGGQRSFEIINKLKIL
jgi:hypothetical protein